MYLGILLYMGIMLYVCFVTDCQRGRLLGFEFVMLANHDKTWQKLSLIGLEWSTLKSKQKLKFGVKKNELQAVSFDWYSIGTCDFQPIENRISAKNSKRKKAITWPFEAQITSRFFQYLKDIIS